MNLNDYFHKNAGLRVKAIASISSKIEAFRKSELDRAAWLGLLAVLFPVVDEFRRESSVIAREYYDAERGRQTSAQDRHDVLLAPYRQAWFERAMRPFEMKIRRAGASMNDVAAMASGALREIENGGRITTQTAVQFDPVAKGWARVAVGDSSCGWCTMLISRGPVYKNEETAGGMTQWHPLCDCRAVAVFDRRSWPGRAQYRAAEKLYKQAAEQDGDTLKNLRALVGGH